MHVLLFEPNHRGHHFPYLARLLPGILRLPVRVTLATTPEALKSREFEMSLAGFGDRISFWTGCRPPQRTFVQKAWCRVADLRRALRQTRPDAVGLMYGDGLWQIITALDLLGQCPIPRSVTAAAWLYRGGFAYPDNSRRSARIKRRLFTRLLRRGVFDTLYLDDELLHNFAAAIPDAGTAAVLTPNPIDLRPLRPAADARQSLGLPPTGKLISSSGMVSAWKGMDRLIHAFAHAVDHHALSPDTRLLLAGPHGPEILELLRTPAVRPLVDAGRIVSRDAFLDEAQMFDVAAASDLVVAAYPHHSGRSSIILWAAAAGRPVLAAEYGCIGHVVTTQQLGQTFDALDQDRFNQALVQALDLPWTNQDARRVRDYVAWHRIENYQDIGSQWLRRALDRRADPSPSA